MMKLDRRESFDESALPGQPLFGSDHDRLVMAMWASDLGLWDKNLVTGEFHVDERWAAMLGYSIDEVEPHIDGWLQLVHPDDRDHVLAARESHLAGADSHYHIEHRLRTKSGVYKWVLLRGRVLGRDSDGRPVRLIGIQKDITARKQAQEVLRSEQELNERIIATAQNIVLVLDPQGKIVRINPYMEQLTGWRLEEVKGRDWFETFLAPRDRERVRQVFHQAVGGTPTRGNINPIVTRDGRERVIEWHDAPLTDGDGASVGLLAIGHDVTEWEQAQEALRQSEESVLAILDTVIDGVITIDERGTMTRVNPGAQRMFGYTADEMLGQNVRMLMPQPFAGEHDGYIGGYLESRQPKLIGIGREVPGLRKDGSVFPVELAVGEIDHMRQFVGVVRDISQRRELQRRLADASLQEQQQIAQDLHDGLSGQLAGLGMLAAKLQSRLREANSPDAELASKVTEFLADAQRQLRAIAHGLAPVEPTPGGLAAALRRFVASGPEVIGAECELRCDGDVTVDDPLAAANLFRVAQEAVNNAVRHGRAKRVTISLAQTRSDVTLSVCDDGCGFADSRERRAGMGLRSMRYRADLIGGKLTIDSAPGQGTTVTCALLRILAPSDGDRRAGTH